MQAKEIMESSDIMLNLGNKTANMVPFSYLSRYPLALLLDERLTEFDKQAHNTPKAFYDFLSEC